MNLLYRTSQAKSNAVISSGVAVGRDGDNAHQGEMKREFYDLENSKNNINVIKDRKSISIRYHQAEKLKW